MQLSWFSDNLILGNEKVFDFLASVADGDEDAFAQEPFQLVPSLSDLESLDWLNVHWYAQKGLTQNQYSSW